MKQQPVQLIFVCIGNRNRSPFSEFFFAKLMIERDKDLVERVEVRSAGFVPQVFRDYLAQIHIDFPEPYFGRPVAEMTRTILLQRGIFTPPHWRTKELTPKMVEEADFIVTAEPIQKTELLILFPKAAGKIFSLRELATWDKPLVLEDNIEPTANSESYWGYLEENPEYVTTILAETENLLVRGHPRIMEKLRQGRSVP